MKPTTAEYQRHRKATLRSLERARVLANAREMARENQRVRKCRYTRETLNILKGRAA